MSRTVETRFMQEAIRLAIENIRSGRGGPFAALVVRDGEIISSGTNLVTSANDPTAHAEIEAIRAACKTLRSFQLPGCYLYSTCEPCPMCLGAIYWARAAGVFYACTREDAALQGFDDSLIYTQCAVPPLERNIPMQPMLREHGLRVFEEWQRLNDRRMY